MILTDTIFPIRPLRALLLTVMTAVGLTACHQDDPLPNPTPENGAGRMTLVYMVAENSLGRLGFLSADSAEIMAGRNEVAENDRMLFFVDCGGRPTLYRARADRDQPEVVAQWDEDFCSSDPRRLQEVVSRACTLWPDKELGLVMWSHADGWVPPTNTDYDRYSGAARLPRVGQAIPFSFGIDSGPDGNGSNNGAQMSVEGIADALKGAGQHCRYIFFDACLMQNVEVAYALREVTDYVVASPAQTPGVGSNYTHTIAHGLFADDPADIARTYLADAQTDEAYTATGLVTACLRTDQLQELANLLQRSLAQSKLADHQSPTMDGVLAYQAYASSYDYRPHNYDLLQALHRLLPADVHDQADAIVSKLITFHGSTQRVYVGPGWAGYITVPVDEGNYCGVSLFVPQDVYTRNASRSSLGDLNEAFRKTAWYTAAGFSQTGW